MERANDSTFSGFILLGFSNRPQLETALSVLILIIYFLSFLGNGTIILLSLVDSHLHTPMYFFLSNLSFMDLCLTTCTVPQTVANFKGKDKSITYGGCVTQLFVALGLGGVECVLLSVMAYDRYAAVCKPLYYATTMTTSMCARLGIGSYFCSLLNASIHTGNTFRLYFCKSNVVDHFFCDIPAVMTLTCSDKDVNELILLFISSFNIFFALLVILISYLLIFVTVLKMHSGEGYRKALFTCASHLVAVSIFYGTVIIMYLQPSSSHSMDRDKIVSVFYTMLIPMLNPMVYSLRNKEVKNAFRKVVEKAKDSVDLIF